MAIAVSTPERERRKRGLMDMRVPLSVVRLWGGVVFHAHHHRAVVISMRQFADFRAVCVWFFRAYDGFVEADDAPNVLSVAAGFFCDADERRALAVEKGLPDLVARRTAHGRGRVRRCTGGDEKKGKKKGGVKSDVLHPFRLDKKKGKGKIEKQPIPSGGLGVQESPVVDCNDL